MNVGQILETHLGWACAGLGKQIGEMLDKVKRDGKHEPLRRQLKSVYGNDERLGELDDEPDCSSSAAICAPACRSPRRCSTAPRKPTSSTCWTGRPDRFGPGDPV
jgi:DNA-directed RNA polymerase beta subunit